MLNKKSANVAILMCTHQGEDFLEMQLESIQRQTYPHWQLWVSDDSSTDQTHSILQSFKQKIETAVHILSGPNHGFAANFLSLICNETIQADIYSFSDQDDIWHTDKLERAVTWMQQLPDDRPALYCSRTHLIDEQNNSIGHSPLFTRPPSFRNALVQNIGGGNTMVINQAARNLLLKAGKNVDVVSHDWWVYILVSGAEGHIYYDYIPTLDYRQHGKNLIGSNVGWKDRFKRILMLAHGQFQNWNKKHLIALENTSNILTKENTQLISLFSKIQNTNLINRFILLRKMRLYRQTLLGNLGILAATLMNKI